MEYIGIMNSSKRGAPGARKSMMRSSTRRSAPTNDAKRSHLQYVELARAAALQGDPIAAENYYQHADHYFRVARERSGT